MQQNPHSFFNSPSSAKGILDVAVSKRVFSYMLDTCFAVVQHFLCTCHRKRVHKLLMLIAFFSSLSENKNNTVK